MTPRQSAFDRDLAQVADTFRNLLAWDRSRARAGNVRAEYARLQGAVREFIDAWNGLSDQARATLAAVLRDRTSVEPHTLQEHGINAAAQIAAAATEAARMTPSRWHNTAQRLMTGSVRAVCERHQIPFTSTVDAYGQTSKAVAAIRRVAELAGKHVTAVNAAKWIQQELRETKSKKLT